MLLGGSFLLMKLMTIINIGVKILEYVRNHNILC